MLFELRFAVEITELLDGSTVTTFVEMLSPHLQEAYAHNKIQTLVDACHYNDILLRMARVQQAFEIVREEVFEIALQEIARNYLRIIQV